MLSERLSLHNSRRIHCCLGLLMSNEKLSDKYYTSNLMEQGKANCQTLNGKTLTGNDRAKSAVACVK